MLSWFSFVPSTLSGSSDLLQVSERFTFGRNADDDLVTPASAASTCASAARREGLFLSAVSIAWSSVSVSAAWATWTTAMRRSAKRRAKSRYRFISSFPMFMASCPGADPVVRGRPRKNAALQVPDRVSQPAEICRGKGAPVADAAIDDDLLVPGKFVR